MTPEQQIEKAIKAGAKKMVPVFVTEGTVKAVDIEGHTCTVERYELPTLHDVRLNAVLEANNNLVTIIPKVGASVLCIIIENNPLDNFVLTTTDIESVTGEIEGVKFVWNKDGFVFNDGENEGLVIAPTLKTELDNTNEYLEGLKTATKGIATALDVLVPGTSAAFEAALVGKAVGDFSDIQNDKIKH